jgi:glyoxylase-like metal-dependent hydrolase (beta-lactamase superfamily II)
LICFYIERKGVLISGDHLLPEISPNPIIDLSGDGPGPRSRSLGKYLDSVRRIEGLGACLALPGHGEAIRDLGTSIQAVFHHHEQRLSMVQSVVSRGEKTAYEIAKALFPDARSFEAFLGVSEILGHLRILVDRSELVFSSRGGVDYYGISQTRRFLR